MYINLPMTGRPMVPEAAGVAVLLFEPAGLPAAERRRRLDRLRQRFHRAAVVHELLDILK